MGRFINNLWSAFALLENKEEAREFLKDILSHTETKMLAKRLQIAKMLLEGRSYQAIKTYTGVQNSTVAKINNILNTSEGDGLRRVAEGLIELEKRRKLSKDHYKDHYDVAAGPIEGKKLPYSFGTLK